MRLCDESVNGLRASRFTCETTSSEHWLEVMFYSRSTELVLCSGFGEFNTVLVQYVDHGSRIIDGRVVNFQRSMP